MAPVDSRIAKWFDRHTSQEVCPWNAKFSRSAAEEAFAPRPEIATPDVASFATMDDAEFKARFGDTPLSRAKLQGIRRNADDMLRRTDASGPSSQAG